MGVTNDQVYVLVFWGGMCFIAAVVFGFWFADRRRKK